MKKMITNAIILVLFISLTVLVGRSFRVSKIPNGDVNRCANCHINPAGGGARNSFGEDVESRVTPGGSENFWDSDLAALDSDGDGFTNGEELQDAGGSWTGGAIGDPSLVSNPGDPGSFPSATGLEDEVLPEEYSLSQNYPNPFNPRTKINYRLPEAGSVKMEVYDMTGQLIRVLVNADLVAGNHVAFWNGKDHFGHTVASGSYIYRLQAGDFGMAKRMLFLK